MSYDSDGVLLGQIAALNTLNDQAKQICTQLKSMATDLYNNPNLLIKYPNSAPALITWMQNANPSSTTFLTFLSTKPSITT